MMMIAAVSMILRVWAMYTRSKLILGALLALFSVEIVSTLVADVTFQDSRYMSGVWMLLEFLYMLY